MFARFFVLLVCLGFSPAVQAQTNCQVTGFEQIGNSNGESPLYPVDPMCYPKIDKAFYKNPAPPQSNWNEFVAVNSCIELQDVEATSSTPKIPVWFLKEIVKIQIAVNQIAAVKQLFGQLVYLADNKLLYDYLPNFSRNLPGAQAIIPACKQKNNQYARLEFWYNENTHVLKVRFSVAVPYFYASKITAKLSSLDTYKTGLMNIFNPNWLTTALQTAGSHTSSPSCLVSALKQIGQSGASVTCGGAFIMTKADEAKEVQAETAERKLRGAAATEAEEAERKLQAKGPIKIQAKGAVKVKGGGATGTVKTILGGR